MKTFIYSISFNVPLKNKGDVIEEEQDDYASLTLYDVSLQELNVISKL